MRYTYRYKKNQDYWSERWLNLPVDNEMRNEFIYPLKNSISTIKDDKNGKILEAGCGNGRVLRFFHNKGYNIHGIDFIQNAIDKIKKADESLLVSCQSILNTDFKNNEFKYILAFGLYHNFKNELLPALAETSRILQKDGVLCASFRADNLQNFINLSRSSSVSCDCSKSINSGSFPFKMYLLACSFKRSSAIFST